MFHQLFPFRFPEDLDPVNTAYVIEAIFDQFASTDQEVVDNQWNIA
jgi:hypothetical protein